MFNIEYAMFQVDSRMYEGKYLFISTRLSIFTPCKCSRTQLLGKLKIEGGMW